ncbi:hypothetical protein N0V85_002217 [Neurospora sp. IMI 360204]|nr:hypothetical protein N0V85_002217 [Neurospora sp. IMI 360204]
MPNLFKRLSHRRHSEEDRNQHSENERERRSSDPPPSRARLPSLSSWRLPGSSNSAGAGSRTNSTLDAQTVTHSSTIRSPTSVPSHRSPSPRPDGLGLHILHHPESPTHDLIFVHGLGGHSQLTWSKNHNVDLFWPELWLPEDPDVGCARIFTYGYDANYLGGAKNINNITNFAKDLLFQMHYGKDRDGQDLDIGQNPISFVVHSMGGLVVKKAYLMGFHDENYKDIIAAVSAIIFLSTPHRGTSLAETLNNLLQYSFQAQKSFISDLAKNSPAIEDINEQFRHVAPKLSIYSFYETLETTIGPKKVMVLEKDSSVMGYPSEISKPLTADHHDVCKYSSREDHNYKSVVSAIKSLVKLFRSKATNSGYTFANVQELFQATITSDSDYAGLRTDWARGTSREYLTQSRQSELFVDTKNAHAKLFKRCLQSLQEETLRWRLVRNDGALQSTEPFIFYAALNWSYHLRHSKLIAPGTLDDVLVFLKSPGVLSWIHVLALLQKLEIMVKTSKVLATFVSILRKQNESKNPMHHRLLDIDLLHECSQTVPQPEAQ